jgi:hypothetical protein
VERGIGGEFVPRLKKKLAFTHVAAFSYKRDFVSLQHNKK